MAPKVANERYCSCAYAHMRGFAPAHMCTVHMHAQKEKQ